MEKRDSEVSAIELAALTTGFAIPSAVYCLEFPGSPTKFHEQPQQACEVLD